MRHLHRASLIRLAVIPALAAGVSVSAQTPTEPTGTASASTAQTATDTSRRATYRGVRASEMIGMSVRNAQDENIGEISDMVVDLKTGEVRYALLEFDPGILEAEKLFAVPTTELRMAADRDDVVYEISEDKLERASIDRDDWNGSALDDPGYLKNLDTVWGIEQPASGATAQRVSDLIGKEVNGPSGEKIGEVEELVVNMAEQQVHYAVLQFDEGWASPDRNYAVALNSFKLTGDQDELVLDVDKSKLQTMKSFPDSRYSTLNERTWIADIDRSLATVMPPTRTAAGALNEAYTENPKPSELFTRLDQNSDGALDRPEAENLGDAQATWSRFDEDGNGRISQQEFMRSYPTEGSAR